MSVSYLVSSYNKRVWLPSVLATVAQEQADTGGDIVLIDDGSSDGSVQICSEFARNNASVDLRLQANRGIFAVTNQLIAAAAQPWVRIVDSDDPLVPGSTRAMTCVAQARGYDYVFGQMAPYGPEEKDLEAINAKPSPSDLTNLLRDVPDPYRYAIREYWHVPSTTVFRRGLLDDCELLPEHFVSCQDLALALRLFAKARVAWVETPVCHQLIGVENRLSAKESLTLQQTALIIAEYGERHFSPFHKRMAVAKLLARASRRVPKWSKLQMKIMTHRILPEPWRLSLGSTPGLFSGNGVL
jgi:glycosyltransferase involved in cell wall biosynthesis